MKALCLLVAVLLLPMAGWAKKKPLQACTIPFSIIQQDTLGNVKQGVSAKMLKWLTKDLRKKYPEVCYRPPDPSVRTVLVIVVVPDTYHGTQVISKSNPSSGTVTNNQGEDVGTYSGTNQSSTAVPYSFEYGKYMLTIETLGSNHQVTVRHRFEQNGIYNTLYGIPLGGRGHHPEKAVIEDAVKWIHAGGLDDPLQSAQ